MAKAGRVKKQAGVKRRSRLASILSRVFARRNIIIISDHKTQHVPVHPLLQLIVFMAGLGFVTWASYSTGGYMTAQAVLQEKERKLAFTKEENERIGAEFALLRRDLGKLLKEGNQNPGIKTLWTHMPMEEGPEVAPEGEVILKYTVHYTW